MGAVKLTGATSGSTTITAPDSGSDEVIELSTALGSKLDASAPVGKILQVASALKTNTFTTSSTSFVDVTDVSVTVTPKDDTSKFLIFITGMAGISVSDVIRLNIVRGSTAIAQSTGGSSSNQTTTVATVQHENLCLTVLDSPATESAVTYKLQIAVASGTGVIGRYASADNRPAVTVITVLEVGA